MQYDIEYHIVWKTKYRFNVLNGKYDSNIRLNKKKLKQKFEVEASIRKKIIGYYAYYEISGNYSSLLKYYKYLKYTWYYTLRKHG